MSLVLLEALASGLPVVTARTCGGAEVITPGCGVVLESPEDVAGIAAAIAHMAGEPEHARRMGAAARELAKSLSWARMSARYLSLYEQIAAAPVSLRAAEGAAAPAKS
jgi:glycosyltransferase involved in cell wall biosynthesis